MKRLQFLPLVLLLALSLTACGGSRRRQSQTAVPDGGGSRRHR